jgi:hypothetical protein
MLTSKSNIAKDGNIKKAGNSFFPAKGNYIQPKLTINQPNDIYEQEADAAAEKVMRMPDAKTDSLFFRPKPLPLTSVQRRCAACEQEEKLQRKEDEEEQPIQLKLAKEFDVQRKCSHCEEEEKLQMKGETNAGGGMVAPSAVHDVINSSGQKLDEGTRGFMESRFGYDFGNVQIHNDSLAHQSSSEINALAYAHGNHIVFGSGQYQPSANSWKRLLAHELTHVIQQTVNAGITNPVIQRRTPGQELIPPQKDKETEFICNPTPVTHKGFVEKGKELNFDPKGAFGITVFLGQNAILPAVQLNGKNHLEPTRSSVTIPSVYIQKDELFPDEGGKTLHTDTCDSDALHYLITSDGASKIAEGENEHCSDFRLAFNMSLAKYTTAVNKLAKAKTKFKNLSTANEKLKKITGIHPDDWADTFICLTKKTRLRDSSDHRPPPLMTATPYPTQEHCRFPVVRIWSKTYPEIGLHPSKDIVKMDGCP